jgi:site-specific recombinase XerD
MNTTPLPLPFTATLESFLRSLVAKNRTPATLTGYRSDVGNFLSWLCDTTPCAHPQEVRRTDVTEYLAERGQAGVSGLSRARNLAAIREYFRHLVDDGRLTTSPAEGIVTPKREKRGRNYLSEEAYTKLLNLAGGTPRDYAILQLFLQTGVRVSELAALSLDDMDLDQGMLRVTGKGMADREIPLNRKAVWALRTWQAARRRASGIEKRITPHSLRHTFATEKARRGIGAFQLRDFLGHASVATTQIYVHLSKTEAKKLMEATSL